MDKYIGRLLDNRYEILEVIGTGGMAVVYKARCHRLNRLVAIKILKDDYLEDEEFRRRFHAESQAVAMLGHPNIVAVYDVSTSIMADYIVMELIDGITLKQYMEKKGVLNWKETLHFAIQIAKALEHAHSRGIVHRDIKPHNVMVLKNGSVKVADFDIARMMSKGNTLTKEALGSVHYISPEQAKGGRVDSRSDIYSLGVVMYEMMSGRPPYDGESPVAVAIQHINGGAVMPSTLNPNIPGGMEQIIMKAMAHSIDERYASASAMLSDMDEFRKNPAMLFDYNTPPLDAVTRLPKPSLVLEPAAPRATTAERVARRNTELQNRQKRTGSGTSRKVSDSDNTGSRKPERRRRSADAEESRSRVATFAIISCSLVMVVAILIFLVVLLGGGAFGQREQLVEVPQLIGLAYDTIGEKYGDFVIKLRESVYHDTVPKGQIISHEPSAEEMVGKGSDIYITVSKGPEPEPVYMQDVIGLNKDEVKRMLDNMSLKLQVSFEEEASDTVPSGHITRTKPAESEELIAGQSVVLWVSTGPDIKTSSMPNVVGETKENAEKTLDSQNLNLDLVYEEDYHSSIKEGYVIRTDPIAGTDISTGDKVTIWISLGPELQNMPNVVGMDVGTASKLLVDAGFKQPSIQYVDSDEAKDTVVNQSEQKDTWIDITTQITLEISKGPKPTEPPATTAPPETTAPETVTKNVTFTLGESTAGGESTVRITRGDTVVYNAAVPQGTQSVTVENQTGSGVVTYFIIINDQDGWEVQESFTNNE